jgi:5'-nucleotidase
MKKVNILTIGIILFYFTACASEESEIQDEEEIYCDNCLTILHNNDAESQLVNAGLGREDFGGVDRFGTLVKKLKKEADNNGFYLMLSSGDNLISSPEFNVSLEKEIYFDARAMDIIGYDAIALGNHDFDFGTVTLSEFIDTFARNLAPFITANLDFTNEPELQALVDQGRIAKSVVIEKDGQKFGIVGATTTTIEHISSPGNTIIDSNIAQAVQGQVDDLVAAGINKIILISHLQSVMEELELAPQLSGVDIIIAGGGHELLANGDEKFITGDKKGIYGPYPLKKNDKDGKEVLVVTTKGDYNYVGRLIVEFDEEGNVSNINDRSGPVRVAGGKYSDGVKPDLELETYVTNPVADVLSLMTEVVGTTEVPLDGRKPMLRSRETNLGNLVADSLLWQGEQIYAAAGIKKPDVALQNGGGIRNDSLLPIGNITKLDAMNILSYINYVTIVEDVDRTTFKEIMENAASRVAYQDGRFAQIAGFKYTWDSDGKSQILDKGVVTTVGTRVKSLCLTDPNGNCTTEIIADGDVIPGDPITVSTINFLAAYGDEYKLEGFNQFISDITYREGFEAYIQDVLGGVVTSSDYPQEGVGRITCVGTTCPE